MNTFERGADEGLLRPSDRAEKRLGTTVVTLLVLISFNKCFYPYPFYHRFHLIAS